ncbi:MAG: dockerin type I repeat-containing protein [Ruminococcus sp.]|nr:dockerin type I repeat-containing protein [Ruminococcus sp.]
MKKLFKSFLCITLASLMLLSLIPSAFAASISKDYADNYMPGTVLVGVKKDAPTLQEIIPEFEIVRTEYAQMDPVYISYVNSPNADVTYIKLVLAERTKEVVLKAIEALNQSEYVTVAEPFYCVYQRYAEGRVIVSLDNGVSIGSVTEGLNITDTRLLTPGSDLRIYLIYLEEQTKEIVWEAMQILNGKKGVKCAEPDYYGEFTVVPVYKNGDADEDGELSVIDATMVQRYLVDSTVAVNMVNSDMNYDGKVTILDATAIQRSLANL